MQFELQLGEVSLLSSESGFEVWMLKKQELDGKLHEVWVEQSQYPAWERDQE